MVRRRNQHHACTPYGWTEVKLWMPLLGFNGQHRDPRLDCYLLGNGYRVYNPMLMRCLSPDEECPFGKGGRNAYAYCENDPVNKQDPSGRIPSTLKIWKGYDYRPRARAATEPGSKYARFRPLADAPGTSQKNLRKIAKLEQYEAIVKEFDDPTPRAGGNGYTALDDNQRPLNVGGYGDIFEEASKDAGRAKVAKNIGKLNLLLDKLDTSTSTSRPPADETSSIRRSS